MVKLKETLINKFPQEKLVKDDDSFLRFCNIILAALHENDPRKIKHVRSTQTLFLIKNYRIFDKDLLKTIMTRTKLYNTFLRSKGK